MHFESVFFGCFSPPECLQSLVLNHSKKSPRCRNWVGKKYPPQAACNKEQSRHVPSVVASSGCVFYLKTQTLHHLEDAGACAWLQYHKVHRSFCAYRMEHSRDNTEVKNLKKTCYDKDKSCWIIPRSKVVLTITPLGKTTSILFGDLSSVEGCKGMKLPEDSVFALALIQ